MSNVQEPLDPVQEPLDPFEQKLTTLVVWASSQTSRARDMAWEWLAGGFIVAALYVLWVVAPKSRISLIDLFALTLAVGGGIVMHGFETRSANALDEFAKDVLEKLDPTSEPES